MPLLPLLLLPRPLPPPPLLRVVRRRFSCTPPLQQQCISALRHVRLDGDDDDIVYRQVVRGVQVRGGEVTVHLQPLLQFRTLRQRVQQVLGSIDSITNVKVSFGSVPCDSSEDARSSSKEASRPHGLADTKAIVAVSSCKGGVGKSTIALNLAYSLSSLGLQVSMFDADFYGPSLPCLAAGMQTILGQTPTPRAHRDDRGRVLPIVVEGVKLMSFGFVSSDEAAVLRGPVVSRLVQQLIFGTRWGNSDVLIIDLPPGTGDINLSICQSLSLNAAVAVTTPHPLSYTDVLKSVAMMGSLGVPTIAAVQNMSTFQCSHCNAVHSLFGDSVKQRLNQDVGIANVLDMPLCPHVADLALPLALNTKSEVSALRAQFAEFAASINFAIQDLETSSSLPPEVIYEHSRGVVVKLTEELVIPAPKLRQHCQCASCSLCKKNGTLVSVSNNVEPLRIRPVGNYAVSIDWSDGHQFSIYSFEMLQQFASSSRH